MGTALLTPGDGLPSGMAVVQPTMAGQLSIKVGRIGGDRAPTDYSDQLSIIAGRLEKLAGDQVTAKALIETRWLEDVRAFHGVYDSDKMKSWQAAGQSTAFVKTTRAKTVTLEARLFDLIFPTDDRNWGIGPTPVPKLAAERVEAEQQAHSHAAAASEAVQNGQDPTQSLAAGNDQAARAAAAVDTIDQFTKAAKAMQEEMDDQLVESSYPQEARDLIHDACLLGTGILKGPMVSESTRGTWMKIGDTHTLEQRDDARPLMKRVDPWSFFPDMSGLKIGQCEFNFERYLWSKSQLRKMVKTHGFDADAVRELLRERDGRRPVTSPSISNLVLLRSLTDDSAGRITGRYVGWEYHGPLECEEIVTILRAQGRDEEADAYAEADDPLEEHRVIVYICEGQILKIAPEYPLDSGETLYSIFNIEDAEGSLFGYGVPRIMRDSGDALNSTWRMMLDNAALSVGPQSMIDKTQIAPADGDWVMRAKKVWLRIMAATQASAKPIEFFNVPNVAGELDKIIQLANVFIDLETGIPQPQQGEQGAHTTQTVGGMAILQNAANIIFRRIVKNFDDGIITPTMRRLYDWNMQFNPDESVKGDMQVDARGTSVLLLKEVQATNLMLIVTQLMANPNIAMMLKPYNNVQKLFQAMMIKPSDVMVTEDEYQKAMEAQAQQPPPPDAATINANARIESAKIMAQTEQTRDQTTLEIAKLRERTALIELSTHGDLTLAQLQTMLQAKEMDGQAKERMMVSEAAIEAKNAADAKARGEEPSPSGGYFSEGPGGQNG